MIDEQTIFGKSKDSVKARDFLEQIAQNHLSVLIEGESGTGKDAYADYLFSKIIGTKKKIKIDSSLILNLCLDKKTSTDKKDSFLYIFIDRIEKLNVESQNYLLHWINKKEESFQDLRFIFFSNPILDILVSEKKFREDLFFIINKIKLIIPALRERKDDIAPLVNQFISRFALKHDKKIQSIDKNFEKFLYSYHWPGNVRELENFIERAILFSSSNTLEGKDIPSEFFSPNKISNGLNLNIIPGVQLPVYEKEIIQKNLEYTNWNRKKTSALLGISERTLYRKLREYKITTPYPPAN